MRPKKVSGSCPLLIFSLFVVACSSENRLRPFTSDGCSLFPDASVISADDWCSCCFVHDQAYWRGGAAEEREAADAALRDCVLQRTGDETLATLMYEGVRFGGSPYFYNWYRWGYGWKYGRGYEVLTPAESLWADELLDAYFRSGNPGVCTSD